MAASDIRQFYFYVKYIWRAQDFLDMQTWERSWVKAVTEGALGGSILTGCRVVPNTGMQVNIEAGIAVSATGQLMVIPSTQNATFATPAGNPAKSLVVARPKFTDANNIPDPLNPPSQVPLQQIQGYEIVVLDGVAAPSPVYPTPQTEDVVLMGVTLTNGQTTIAYSDLDRTPIYLPRKRVHPISVRTAQWSVDADRDELVEIDCSTTAGFGNLGILPDARQVPGRQYTFMKIDSGANAANVSGQLGQTLSGQAYVSIDDQWGSFSVYSNGLNWRVL